MLYFLVLFNIFYTFLYFLYFYIVLFNIFSLFFTNIIDYYLFCKLKNNAKDFNLK